VRIFLRIEDLVCNAEVEQVDEGPEDTPCKVSWCCMWCSEICEYCNGKHHCLVIGFNEEMKGLDVLEDCRHGWVFLLGRHHRARRVFIPLCLLAHSRQSRELE